MEEEAPEGLGGKLDLLAHLAGLADPRQPKKVLCPLDEGAARDAVRGAVRSRRLGKRVAKLPQVVSGCRIQTHQSLHPSETQRRALIECCFGQLMRMR